MIGRRAFLAALACMDPIAPFAQARALRIGFVGLGGWATDAPAIAAVRDGLDALAALDGLYVTIDSRQAAGDLSAAEAAVLELASLPVGVFLSPGPAMTRIMHRKTSLPIVAIGLTNADRDLFQTLAKPSGRVTGFAMIGEDLSDKRLELLRELMPGLKTVGVMHNRVDPNFEFWGTRTADAGRRVGITVVQAGLKGAAREDVAQHMSHLRKEGVSALIVLRDFVTSAARDTIIAEAAVRNIATISEIDGFAQAGALAAFGPDLNDVFRRAAGHAYRIIRGANPADIPIEAPTRFKFVLNLGVARRLGLDVPSTVLARADEVIE